MAPKWK